MPFYWAIAKREKSGEVDQERIEATDDADAWKKAEKWRFDVKGFWDLVAVTKEIPCPGAAQAKPEKRYLKIQILGDGRPRLWKLIDDNDWSGAYFGKGTFSFTDEQLNAVNDANISFMIVD